MVSKDQLRKFVWLVGNLIRNRTDRVEIEDPDVPLDDIIRGCLLVETRYDLAAECMIYQASLTFVVDAETNPCSGWQLGLGKALADLVDAVACADRLKPEPDGLLR